MRAKQPFGVISQIVNWCLALLICDWQYFWCWFVNDVAHIRWSCSTLSSTVSVCNTALMWQTLYFSITDSIWLLKVSEKVLDLTLSAVRQYKPHWNCVEILLLVLNCARDNRSESVHFTHLSALACKVYQTRGGAPEAALPAPTDRPLLPTCVHSLCALCALTLLCTLTLLLCSLLTCVHLDLFSLPPTPPPPPNRI